MINTQWLKLPISRTIFHGPKWVRAIEVRLYIVQMQVYLTDGVFLEFSGRTFQQTISIPM